MQLVTNDAGAPTALFAFDGNYEGARELFERDSMLCAFELKEGADALVIALAAGFRAAMLVGIACYAIAYLLIRSLPAGAGQAVDAG